MDEEKKQPDLVLSDGREINFDLRKITIGEYRNLFKPETNVEDEDALMCRVSGLQPEEYMGLSYYDFNRFWSAFHKKRREPIDPN